eukprot:TRINITY_DN19144_c1_g1_i2.p1 TRINITY_DN19144_c1_g1~~TRINITY_DN19144_c1_g1_i2.p1  ORF type:complete len:467 (+),score=96.54 TRINITY_DN19144_c1_g1_i2:167-1567(+)
MGQAGAGCLCVRPEDHLCGFPNSNDVPKSAAMACEQGRACSSKTAVALTSACSAATDVCDVMGHANKTPKEAYDLPATPPAVWVHVPLEHAKANLHRMSSPGRSEVTWERNGEICQEEPPSKDAGCDSAPAEILLWKASVFAPVSEGKPAITLQGHNLNSLLRPLHASCGRAAPVISIAAENYQIASRIGSRQSVDPCQLESSRSLDAEYGLSDWQLMAAASGANSDDAIAVAAAAVAAAAAADANAKARQADLEKEMSTSTPGDGSVGDCSQASSYHHVDAASVGDDERGDPQVYATSDGETSELMDEVSKLDEVESAAADVLDSSPPEQSPEPEPAVRTRLPGGFRVAETAATDLCEPPSRTTGDGNLLASTQAAATDIVPETPRALDSARSSCRDSGSQTGLSPAEIRAEVWASGLGRSGSQAGVGGGLPRPPTGEEQFGLKAKLAVRRQLSDAADMQEAVIE